MENPLPVLILRLVAALLVVAALVGCGRDEAKSPASQVAAQVNSDEITVHQINAMLARAPDVTAESAAQVKRQTLERLVEQRLAVQQALRRKLDRTPEVVQATEAARAEVLARAFADAIARTQAKPTPDEVAKYYAAHPALFAERRVYVLEELNLEGSAEGVPGLAEQVARSRSLRDVAVWLGAKAVKFSETRGVRTAEQIPMDQLPRLHSMKEGEMRVLELGPDKLRVARVVAAKPAPVDAATAAPRIAQFLFNRKVSEALAKEMQQVRNAAKVVYLGEFADGADAVPRAAIK